MGYIIVDSGPQVLVMPKRWRQRAIAKHCEDQERYETEIEVV